MPCFHPIEGWASAQLSINGKRPVVFKKSESNGNKITIACGQCRGCRIDRSKAWALRCVHEASLHDHNSFLTLTYNEDNVPWDGSLNKRHHQLFIKRLRKHIEPKKIRFFHCGEYGAKLQRPHYHSLIFGHHFPDKYFWKQSATGANLHRSDTLETLWPYGASLIGAVTFESAAYVARYILKKITGDQAPQHYEHVNTYTGEITCRQPEYITMSLKPAIGHDWYGKYKDDCYPSDFVTLAGKKYKVPKYYDCLLQSDDEEAYLEIKDARQQQAKLHKDNNTPARLAVREKCTEYRLGQLPRTYEDNDQ